jgi:hypothetical protein
LALLNFPKKGFCKATAYLVERYTLAVLLQLNMLLFHSPQVEPLLVHLAERLETPLDDTFAAETVVVPPAVLSQVP